MNKELEFSEIETIIEFDNPIAGGVRGVYTATYDGRKEVFIRVADTLGVVIFFLDKKATECIGKVRADVTEKFLIALAERNDDADN